MDEIEIQLGDSAYTLRMTVAALRKINRKFSSLMDCAARISRFDYEAIAFTVSALADLNQEDTRKMEVQLVGSLEAATSAITECINSCLGPKPEGNEPGES